MRFLWVLIKYIIPPALLAALLFAIGLWSNYSDQAKTFGERYIAPILDYEFPVIFTFLFLYYLFVAFYDYSKSIVSKKDAELTEKDNEMKDELAVAIKLNKQYSVFRKKELLQGTIKSFVNDQPYIQAVQVYSYNINHIGRQTRIKLKYNTGYIEEGVDLNAMDQAYYSLDKKMFIDFQKASELLNREANASPDLMLSFIERHANKLSAITTPTDNDAVNYALTSLGLDLIETRYDIRLHEHYLNSIQINALEEQKRTGILRAILLKNDFIIFKNRAIGLKQGRMYAARPLNLWGDNIVYLMTYHPDIVDDTDYYADMRVLDKKFMDTLRGLMYNVNINISHGGDADEQGV